ncbi:MAG: sugar ABC transporter substrate-binding protein, partial [Oscillospiraceae bacterium]|nr:sugar ABC transporter substrate-binding protein [Oscillospiraceae bacterium]
GGGGTTTATTATQTAEAVSTAPAAQTTTATTAASVEKRKVVYIAGGLNNPSAKIITEAMEKEVERLGNIELQIMDGESSPEKQLPLFENCITMKPAAVGCSTQDPMGQIPIIRRVVEAGIPFLACESTLDISADFDYYGVGGDLELEGKVLGDFFAETLPPNAKYAHLTGMAGNMATILRDKGFDDAIAVRNDVEKVFYQTCDFDRAKALSATQDLLQSNPDIDAIYAIDTPMALGALQALKLAGRNGQVSLVGIALTDEGIQAMRDGDMNAIIKMDLELEGIRIANMLADMAWEKEPEWTNQIGTCKYYTIQPILVTMDNLDDEI